MTDIPIQWLFGVIAGLVALMYADLKRGQIDAQKSGARRDIILAKICQRLGMRWDGR